MTDIETSSAFDAVAFMKATNVSRETLADFHTWYDLLKETNQTTNLVGRSTLPDFWFRHAYDSVQVFHHAPDAKNWLDLGAGAGFPGLAIAFLLKAKYDEGARVTLVESIQKKTAFLKQVIEATQAPAVALPVRAETLNPDLPVDVVTARAMASLDKLLTYAEPFATRGAICLFPKGAKHKEELTQAQKNWTFDVEVLPSMTAPDAAILKIERLRRVR